ncbi:Cytidylate kinase [bioreactor metagenome]|uniref:Cytidylate kinase n=1 Tax=bioreactor metagenome TaxID=1076179 RepID=A0A644UA01_9ZZZZ|nr:adenylate kinase [Methanobrevibacter sp.]MEA4956695.1 adenylate kinase [Methanobrevibacter sp.]
MKLVVLTGIPGSGSTTVLEHTLKKVNYVHLNYGDVMTEIAIEKGIVKDRDELRKLSPETQKEIQKKAAAKIKESSTEDNIIVDTHCTISTPSGFLPGLPKWVLEELKPDTFVLIEADPDEIMLRRISDETRTRDLEMYDDIKLHQEMNRAASMAYATLTGATVKILENHNDQLDVIVDKLFEIL